MAKAALASFLHVPAGASSCGWGLDVVMGSSETVLCSLLLTLHWGLNILLGPSLRTCAAMDSCGREQGTCSQRGTSSRLLQAPWFHS
jgi:hypothetical protein